MSTPEDHEFEHRRRAEAIDADQRRFEEVNGLPEAITGIASSPDGSVTVEVGMGGGLRSVRLTPQALQRGAEQLSQMVLAVAAHATARANQRAEYAFRGALGAHAARALAGLGLGYDPSLVDDADEERDPLRGWRV